MFLSSEQIKRSIQNLRAIHPFYGTIFLACKRAGLPVGRVKELPIAVWETELLDEYYRPIKTSEFYFHPFITNRKDGHWKSRKKYAVSTLQSMRIRGDFSTPFRHDKNTTLWGWEEHYVQILKQNLSKNLSPYRDKPIPVFDLAVWLYRDVDWPVDTKPQSIIEKFKIDFQINQAEQAAFLDVSTADHFDIKLFQEQRVQWSELKDVTGLPQDVPPEEDGTLAYLELCGVGPAKRLVFEPAERLNLITGDNGLGKTFLLECAWWALTGQWANPNLPAYPRPDADKNDPKIIFRIAGDTSRPTADDNTSIAYDWNSTAIDKWPTPNKRPIIPGLLVYARVDGSFAVCDPAGKSRINIKDTASMPRSFVFTREQIWNGSDEDSSGQKRPLINGLIFDWLYWQNDPDQSTFNTFKRVLSRLSPPERSDLGTLKVGKPVRLPNDSRPIPTLEHPYGVVPILHAAAGVRRIITLAYLLVWAWNEHKINSYEARRNTQKRMVVLVDELEAHLHPQWQRRILPALMEVREDLEASNELQVQSVVATHSPLVLASAEPFFDQEVDKLFHLDIEERGLFANQVEIEEIPFVVRGRVDHWLTWDVFELGEARSLEAETAIEQAKLLQQQTAPNQKDIRPLS